MGFCLLTGDSEPSESSTDSESDPKSRRKKKGGGTKKRDARRIHWELVNAMWSVEDRPRHLQDRKVVAGMTITEISQFKEHYEKEELKKGGGSALSGRIAC